LSLILASLVRPKVRRSIHYCEATEQTITRDYRDATSLGPFFISNNVYPTKVSFLIFLKSIY